MELKFDKEKETKNTVRYQEVETDQAPAIGALYIQKWAVKQLGDPQTITIKLS